ncbi:hypothetical protein DXG01_000688 [Tephrocybe rancida]|nr:hypothetical protein DXG01_000688 [Tephrocybe rancida]
MLLMPWMENGTITDYLKRNHTAPRALLAHDVASGLLYLHNNDTIHGDLEGANVLVDRVGRAQVADFGISSVSDPAIVAWSTQSATASIGGTLRWQAPELHVGDDDNDEGLEVKNTMQSDVYAWACVCLEIFTGKVPFAHILNNYAVTRRIHSGGHSPRPPVSDPAWKDWGLSEEMWTFMCRCWDKDPSLRPSAAAVVEHLQTIIAPDTRLRPEARLISAAEFRSYMRTSETFERATIEEFNRIPGLHKFTTGDTLVLVFGQADAGKRAFIKVMDGNGLPSSCVVSDPITPINRYFLADPLGFGGPHISSRDTRERLIKCHDIIIMVVYLVEATDVNILRAPSGLLALSEAMGATLVTNFRIAIVDSVSKEDTELVDVQERRLRDRFDVVYRFSDDRESAWTIIRGIRGLPVAPVPVLFRIMEPLDCEPVLLTSADTRPIAVSGVTVDDTLVLYDFVLAVAGLSALTLFTPLVSSFINYAVGKEIMRVGYGLQSETSPEDTSRRYVFVDIPGFNDADVDDQEIVGRIVGWLKKSVGDMAAPLGPLVLSAAMGVGLSTGLRITITNLSERDANVDRLESWLRKKHSSVHRFRDSRDSAWNILRAGESPVGELSTLADALDSSLGVHGSKAPEFGGSGLFARLFKRY